jgi:prepilin-type N-terminal cleavage/methylation domain-containing protein
MAPQLPSRSVREERGLTLVELLVVLAIVGILVAIAALSGVGFKARSDKAAAKADVRALVPSVVSWEQDNSGTANDVDGDASTSGYQGMTLALLKSQYDQSLDTSSTSPFALDPTGFTPSATDYCIVATVGGWTASKHGPTGQISVTAATSFDAAGCS